MKIFLVSYSFFPSAFECSVVIAENKEKCFNIVQKNYEEYIDDIYGLERESADLILVSDEKEVNKDKEGETKCYIEEIKMKESIIYTGYFCC